MAVSVEGAQDLRCPVLPSRLCFASSTQTRWSQLPSILTETST
jgi:hypothetical protein